ncbi:sugar porter family MFS transporter [Patulibacter sp. SYSU D01012]|uniref:sugar porter family MFS transporter n=1 Tax=Patulibacter sp. SYSU D01012 TaxID=2817381 RepID=UPI001B30BB15|nr:sugar porter family MFS transporter [Patulibacter sp. SYSU D01012]
MSTPSTASPDEERDDLHVSRVILTSGVAALGGFLFGFDSSVINGATAAIRDEFDLNSFVQGFVVAIALLGAAIGAWYAGRIADRYGRIRVMVITAGVFILSSLGSMLAFSWVDLAVWRLVGGAAIGSASVIAPAYIAEIAPAGLRGRLGSLQQLAIVVGIFVALLSDYFLAEAAGGADQDLWLGLEAWRWMFLAAAVPALVYGVLALQIPESPRYLVAHDREREARSVLRRFVGGDPDSRIREILRTLKGEGQVRVRDLRGPRFGLLPIVWVGILLSVFQQAVGINVIFYYSSQLWQSVGFSESDSMITSVITSLVNIVSTLVAIALVDRVGRKPLLLWGSIGMFVTLGTLAVVFGTAPVVDGDPSLEGARGVIALIAANLFVVSFATSWGPAVWVLLGEMFNNRIRATALAVAAAAQWIANFAITTTFPSLSSVSLALAYGLYTAFAFVSIVFVWKAVTETKGRELEDM